MTTDVTALVSALTALIGAVIGLIAAIKAIKTANAAKKATATVQAQVTEEIAPKLASNTHAIGQLQNGSAVGPPKI